LPPPSHSFLLKRIQIWQTVATAAHGHVHREGAEVVGG
jgi:hypothetical protein